MVTVMVGGGGMSRSSFFGGWVKLRSKASSGYKMSSYDNDVKREV